MRALNADPEFKAKLTALHADPEFKARERVRKSERMRALNADPEFKAKLTALHADPEFKARASERMRALHADPEFKAKHSPVAMAGLTDEQRRIYTKLRNAGIARDEALAEAKRATKDQGVSHG